MPGLIRAQGSSSFAGSGERSDVVTENLKRVAASAEQILEILNPNTGLMAELKRWIAQDAGESGQVLEESDLNDSALAQRVNQDCPTYHKMHSEDEGPASAMIKSQSEV